MAAEQYLETKDSVQAPDEMESKRESLSILASLGTTKEFLGVEMSLGDIKKNSRPRMLRNITSDIKLY